MGIDLLLTFVGKCFEFGKQEAFGADRPVVMLDIFSSLFLFVYLIRKLSFGVQLFYLTSLR